MSKPKAKSKKVSSKAKNDSILTPDLQAAVYVGVLLIFASSILGWLGIGGVFSGWLFLLAGAIGVVVAIISGFRVLTDYKNKRPVSFERWAFGIIGLLLCGVIVMVLVQALISLYR